MLARDTTGGPRAEVSELIGVGIGIGIGIEWRRAWRLGMSSWTSTVQDVLEVCGVFSQEENNKTKRLLDRIVTMLTRLGQLGYPALEEPVENRIEAIDTDSDSDADPE